jgi:macrolide-specific efflux system membrane fusion protein
MISDEKRPAGVKGAALGLINTPSRLSQLKRVALILAVCAVLAGGSYYAWRTWFASTDSSNTVLTSVVVRRDIEDTVTATGTLQPKDYVDVGTQVSGQLKKLLVDIGATVKKGQLLAEIDLTVYQSKVDADHAQLLNQQAQIADKQAQLELARLQFIRQQNMAKDNATTKDALQIAEATQQSALAQLNSIKAQRQQTESTLHGDEANLGYTRIYAPMAGTVVSQAAKQGQTLNANQQAPIIMRIADLSTMTVEAQVSEADVPKLHVGMDVYFTTLGGNNRRFYGRLRQIPPTPTVVNNVVLYDALFDVPNPERTLMTQMTAQVFFVLSSAKNAVQVPLTSLHAAVNQTKDERKTHNGIGADPRSQFAGGHAHVSVIGIDGKSTEREVKVGVMNRVSAQITAGLEPGEKVVIGTLAPSVKVQSGGALAPAGQGRHP